jgi:hypothetical protein
MLVGMMPSVTTAQTFSAIDASTTIADFNADGRPDVAVANHLGNRDSAAYRIDFQLSNGRRQSISFASVQRGLRVAAVDVDNDHDLDLVVTPLLGRNVVGIWLNDGAGHFRRGDPDAVPLDAARLSNVTIARWPTRFAPATPGSRRFIAAPPVSPVAIARTDDTPHVLRPDAVALSSRLLLSSLSPRAPPVRI